MTLVNATSKIRLYINELDYSDFLISGQTSDDSSYSTNIITTKGSITLGGSTSVLDYNKTLFPVGSRVTIYSTLDNGRLAKLPRGHLYVLDSSIDLNNRITTLEVGCSLAYLQSREGNYTAKVAELFSLLSNDLLSSFQRDNSNLSTLDTLLEIDGKVIFQDKWGWVQVVDKFGKDGLGSFIQKPKITCFDKHTTVKVDAIGGSIEELPSAVTVEASVDIPSSANDESNDATEPPPFVTSEISRSIKVPDAKLRGSFSIVQGSDQGEGATEATPDCGGPGAPEEEGSEEVSPYRYTINAESYAEERVQKEKVISGRYVSYNGPGNQVDFEYDFEYCSGGTWANSYCRGIIDVCVQASNAEVQKANGLLSKANQAFVMRDDFEGRDTADYSQPGIQQVSDYGNYYRCAANAYYAAARSIAQSGGQNLSRVAREFADNINLTYGYSAINLTKNEYGLGGVLTRKVQEKYIHTASSQKSINDLSNVSIYYTNSSDNTKLDYRYVAGINIQTGGIASGNSRPAGHSNAFLSPSYHFNVVLASRTTTVYNYGTTYTTETQYYEDYENPINNKTTINYSSTGSKNAPQEDRLEVQKDAAGCVYLNEETSSIDTKDLTVTQEIDITNPLSSPVIPSGWMGTPGRTSKTIQLPLDFAPLRAKKCGNVVTYPDVGGSLTRYYSILHKYAVNMAKKFTADNFGYRIVEKGTRAELFEYYPFYPVGLVLSAFNKYYRLRAASSNWVFDSENVLCSLDCYNVAEVLEADDANLISPTVFKAFGKTEGTKILNEAFWDLPDTTFSITLVTTPSNGLLQYSAGLSGWLTLSPGDQISLARISSNKVRFVPSGTGTVSFEITYEVNGTNGQVRSDVNIYPPLQIQDSSALVSDAGEFTANTTNGGPNADSGDFDAGTALGGAHLDAGDFNSGAEVTILEPLPPSGATTANGSADPEADFGINVLDSADALISSTTLPGAAGDVDSHFAVTIDFRLIPRNYLHLECELQVFAGWDYGSLQVENGTEIDMGSIVDPNTYQMNFGTITTPLEPLLISSVV